MLGSYTSPVNSSLTSAASSSPVLLSPATRQQNTDPPVILDIGARGIRAGIAGHSSPLVDLPLAKDPRGRIKTSVIWPLDLTDSQAELKIRDHLFVLLQEIYYRCLLLDGRTRKVVILENPRMSLVIKRAIAFVLFNNFQAISATFFLSPLATTIAAGSNSALVVDIGWHETTVTPILYHKPLIPGIVSTQRGSSYLHSLVHKALQEAISDKVSVQAVDDFVSSSLFMTPLSSPIPADSAFTAVLDGVTHYVSSLMTRYQPVFSCFFARAQDGFDDFDSIPLPELILSSMRRLGPDARARLSGRIVVTGAAAAIPGLRLSILDSLKSALPSSEPTNSRSSIPIFRPEDSVSMSLIDSLGSWVGASLYITAERDYNLRRTAKSTSLRSRSTGTSSAATFRIPGEIERDRFLTDEEYSYYLYDWTQPTSTNKT
ncbi:uncharacterized protein V1516DRAFT_677531 [Lipomyces oligophaga]|uniref:uncharacterized protein n=1 Tax=Lipomyces oligophaga TaxID=45792 RepID=UPI0034CD8108